MYKVTHHPQNEINTLMIKGININKHITLMHNKKYSMKLETLEFGQIIATRATHKTKVQRSWPAYKLDLIIHQHPNNIRYQGL